MSKDEAQAEAVLMNSRLSKVNAEKGEPESPTAEQYEAFSTLLDTMRREEPTMYGFMVKQINDLESVRSELDTEKFRDMGCTVSAADLLSVSDFVRHDSEKLTKALIKLIEKHRFIKR